MKKVIAIYAFILLFAGFAAGQCTATADDPCIEVRQSTIDRAAKAIDELAASRIAISKLEAAAAVDASTIKAAHTAIDTLQRAIQTGLEIQKTNDLVIETLKGVVRLQGEVIDRLEKMLRKPKSGFARLVAILEKVVLVAAGITFGRGL